MTKIFAILIPILLIGQYDISITDDLSTILNNNKFHDASIAYNGTIFQYTYLPINSSINFGEAKKVKKFGKNDILTHLWNLIVFHNNHELSKIRPLAMSDDLIQSVSQDRFESIWESKSIDSWYFTDVIVYQEFLILRSERTDTGQEKSIDIWAFSFEDGTWKFNLYSSRYSGIDRFQGFIFKETLPLTQSADNELYGPLEIGDTLHVYLAKQPAVYSLGDQKISDWLEGQKVSFMAYDQAGKPGPPYILTSTNEIPFGVLEGNSPEAYYLFDTNGDGALDFKTEKPFLPIYLVDWSSTNRDSKSNKLTSMLDILYDSYNSVDGFSMNETTKTIWDGFLEAGNNYDYANRDLIYVLKYYFSAETPEIALAAMTLLDKRYRERYKDSHPIIKLFCLESSSQNNKPEKAAEYCHELITIAPGFLPARYYQYKYETDQAIAKKYLSRLEGDSNHWLIKSLF